MSAQTDHRYIMLVLFPGCPCFCSVCIQYNTWKQKSGEKCLGRWKLSTHVLELSLSVLLQDILWNGVIFTGHWNVSLLPDDPAAALHQLWPQAAPHGNIIISLCTITLLAQCSVGTYEWQSHPLSSSPTGYSQGDVVHWHIAQKSFFTVCANRRLPRCCTKLHTVWDGFDTYVYLTKEHPSLLDRP